MKNFFIFKRQFEKEERLLASKNELYQVTYKLLTSCYEEECCSRETFRAFVQMKQTLDSDLHISLKIKLEAYYNVFFQQRILYPLRFEEFNVVLSPKALKVLGYRKEEPIHTYDYYNDILTLYASRELSHLVDYFR